LIRAKVIHRIGNILKIGDIAKRGIVGKRRAAVVIVIKLLGFCFCVLIIRQLCIHLVCSGIIACLQLLCGFFIVVAVVNSSTYDPNSDNNNANNTTNVSPSADLSIEKVVIAIDGEYVTWSIKVTNLGPDTAINTRASDVLSNALILVAYDLTTGSFDPNTGVWTIGDMQNGDVAILIIQTLVNATGTIVNEARVVSDTYDPNMTNNNDSDYIVVEDVPDVEPPVPATKAVDVTPATGNPLIMVLLALFTLAVGTLRRKK